MFESITICTNVTKPKNKTNCKPNEIVECVLIYMCMKMAQKHREYVAKTTTHARSYLATMIASYWLPFMSACIRMFQWYHNKQVVQ